VDDLLARSDHRLRLLATQHRLGDFRSVCQVRQYRLVYDSAGFRETILEFPPQRLRDLVYIAAQSAFLILAVVIRVQTRRMAQRGFALR
jgi:hypothetical protein